MCYAIPGKVFAINKGNSVTLSYFDEKKKARNEFFPLRRGEYVYAQGGLVIQKIPALEAEKLLKTWKDLFFKLKETDWRLAQQSDDLRHSANAIRQKQAGNSCCVHAIINFSNYCACDCLYCGLRCSNSSLKRYRMGVDDIIKASNYALDELKFKAIVLQSGEDSWYDTEKLSHIVSGILKKNAALVILSIGERDLSVYKKLYKLGARGVLLRFETSNPSLYAKMKPGHELSDRVKLIKELRRMGYLVMTGFLFGLPGQTEEGMLDDVRLTASLQTDMFSCGPFIPHPNTPLADCVRPSAEQVLNTIARVRIMNPEAKILITSSVEAIDKDNGLRLGLLSGGNSLMIDVTPQLYRKLYDIYPDRPGLSIPVTERIDSVVSLLQEIGRAPIDIGL